MNIAYLWVALGGAAGSVGRYWINGLISARFGETFPFGTVFINISGSFLIGVLAAFTSSDAGMTPKSRVLATQLLMIGVCGGYTTFSSFSLQTLRLVQEREWLYAGGNVVISVVLCLIAVWLGYLVGSTLNSMKGN